MTERTTLPINKPGPITKPGPADKSAPTREERLAERLRENLRLRKAQARALDAAATGKPSAQS